MSETPQSNNSQHNTASHNTIELIEPSTTEQEQTEQEQTEQEQPEQEQPEDEEFDETIISTLIEFTKTSCKDLDINISNINTIIKNIMEHIEKTTIKGTKQKDLAIHIFRSFIDSCDILDTIKEKIIELIDSGLIDATIELIIDVSKGNVDVNRIVKTSKKCWIFCSKPL